MGVASASRIAAARRGRDRPRVHLHPDRRHRPVRRSTPSRCRLADRRADARLVSSRRFGDEGVRDGARRRRSRPRSARRPIALVLGIAASLRRPSLPVLRARDDLVPRDPADRPAGHRHRHRPEHDVPDDRHRLRPADDHHRPRHVLRRGRLQQRRSPGCGARPRSTEEASMDLGADTWQTFRHVTLPAIAHGARGRRRCWPSPCRSTRSS